MSLRFFCPQIDEDSAVLTDSEAHHLANVMRKKIGDEVVLFDDSNHEYKAQVTAIRRNEVSLSVCERKEVNRETSFDLHIASALPKGDRQIFLIQKLVELGVKRFIPLICEHGVVKAKDASLNRLRKQVIEASKQCGRNRLMKIDGAQNLPQLTKTLPANMHKIIAHPDDASTAFCQNETDNVCFAIGPEGGFSQAEISLATSLGWMPMSFGARIMRIETSAIALAAWWTFHQRT